MSSLVSVLMATYNEPIEIAKKAIESILSQTYKKIEFIIVNDNPFNHELSTLIDVYAKRDSRVRILNNSTNLGLALSLNRGLEIAKGSYIARMDADDVALPSRIKDELNFLQKNSFDIVSSNMIYIDENDKVLRRLPDLPPSCWVSRLLPYHSCVYHPTVLIRSEVLKDVGGYRDFKTAQDYDLWLRLSSRGYSFGVLNKYLLLYRKREGAISEEKAMLQMLTHDYALTLFKERASSHKKEDSFSLKNYNHFLAKGGFFSLSKKQIFLTSKQIYSDGVYKVRKGEFGGLLLMLKAIADSKFMRKRLYRSIRARILLSWCCFVRPNRLFN